MIDSPTQGLRAQLDRWCDAVRDAGLDGWLVADFRWSSPLFGHLLGLREGVLSRRSFLWLPASGTGEPRVLASRVDGHTVQGLDLPVDLYGGFDDMRVQLQALLGGGTRIAMEYSPDGRLPTISRVDAGLIDMIRGLGVDVVSSGALVAAVSVWNDRQQELHRRAAHTVDDARRDALRFLFDRISERREVTEGEVAARIVRYFTERDMVAGGTPDVAVDANAADPHYGTGSGPGATIRPDAVVLIDLWCKCNEPDAPFADSTWMAYTGANIPGDFQKVFDVTAAARDAALAQLVPSETNSEPITGEEIDQTARAVVREAGMEELLIHRTGHSLGTDHMHGMGTNLDAVEFPDDRPLLAGSGFTVEPGLYLPGKFGVRLEISAIMRDEGPEVTTELQRTVTVPGAV